MNTKSPATIAALESVLHVPCQYSSWWIARRLLQDCWKNNPRVIRDTTFDLRDLPFTDAASDVAWRRELTPDMIGKWCHHVDKNSQYLSARSVYTGIGDPGYASGPVTPGRPGIYHVTGVGVYDGSTFDGKFYPQIIEPGQEWVTNDVLLYALHYGYEFTVTEAWVFEDYKRVLETWALRLWNARAALKGVNDEAYREVKHIAVVGNGGWATSKEKKRTEGWDLIHPNWWADVVGKSRVNMLANLAKYGSPLAVETDGVYFVSSHASVVRAVPGILDRAGELGGYKHEGSFQITEEHYNCARNMGVGELAHMCKVAGGERE